MVLMPLLATLAFMLQEGWSFLDAFYMSVITLTTVGFSEVHPLSEGGRVIVIVYLILGLGVFLYCAAQVGEMLIRVQVTEYLRRRKMDSAIRSPR